MGPYFVPPKQQQPYDSSQCPRYGIKGFLVGGLTGAALTLLLFRLSGSPWWFLAPPIFAIVGAATRHCPWDEQLKGTATEAMNVLWHRRE